MILNKFGLIAVSSQNRRTLIADLFRKGQSVERYKEGGNLAKK